MLVLAEIDLKLELSYDIRHDHGIRGKMLATVDDYNSVDYM